MAFSPNSNLVAAGVNDDTVQIYDANTMTSLYGSISVDVGSGERVNDVEFSPDSSLLAVSIGRSGNQGTNGIVSFINTSTGNFFSSGINPGGEDRFYDTAFSPDSNFIAVGSEGDWYISEIATGTTVASISSPPDSVNAIAWSPDGNYIVMCGAYETNGARVQVHEYDGSGWPIIWEVGTTTSCSSVDFSPDGSKFIVGMYWYEADGATAKIYETTSSLLVDAFSGPRPNNCAGTNNNQCGQIDGVSWHPDGGKIVTSHTRNDEGVYFWYADLDEDQDGYNTYDQGDGVVDAFPTDGSQWNDTDGDGYGDNPAPATNPDACISQFGTSMQDRFGCPDADGDGWSDAGDWAPNDVEQWADSDGDGYGDQYYYDVINIVFHTNQRGDAFPNNPTQWNDSDSDGSRSDSSIDRSSTSKYSSSSGM